MRALARLIEQRSGLVLILTLVLSVIAALSLPLRYDDDVVRFLPQDDPEVGRLNRISERFGSLHVALVGVETEDLFTHEHLRYVRRLATALEGVEEVASVTAVTEIAVVEKGAAGGAAHVELVPEPIPESQDALRRIRDKVLGLDYLAGSVVSEDGTSTRLICQLHEKTLTGEKLSPKAAAESLRAAVAKVERPGNVELHFGGAPFIAEAAANGSQRDLVRLAPYVCGIIMLLIFLSLGSIRAALLALGSVVLGILWTMGIMGWLGKPLTLVSSSLPVILVALGSAYAVHLLVWYLDHDGDVGEMLHQVGWPVTVAALTTVAGFASFLTMNLEPMREFGWQMAVGSAVCGAVSLLVIPAALVRWPIPARNGSRAAAFIDGLLVRVAHMSRLRRPFVLAWVVIIAGYFAFNVPKVRTNMDTRSFFEAGSEPDRADQFMTRQFGGSVFLQVLVTGDLKDPQVLRQMADFEDRIRGVPGVTRVESIAGVLGVVHEALVGPRRIADTRRGVEYHGYLAAVSDPAVSLLVDEDWEGALIQVAIGGFDTKVVGRVTEKIRSLAQHHLPGKLAVVPASQHLAVEVRRDAAERIAALTGAGGERVARIQEILSSGADVDVAPLIERATKILDSQLGGEDDDAMILVRDGADIRRLGRSVGAALAERRLTLEGLRALLQPLLHPDETAGSGLDKSLRVLFGELERLAGRTSVAEVVDKLEDVVGRQPRPVQARIGAIVSDLGSSEWRVPADRAPAGSAVRSVDATVSGYPIVQEAMSRAVHRNQVASVVASLPLVFIILCLVFRSVFAGLVGMIPTALTLLVTFGLMGIFNERLPLDIGSSMLGAIALGVGIDYAIHFLWRYREQGVSGAMRTVGRSILINAVEITAGFVVLAGASIVPMSNFGILTAETLGTAAVATLVLMPAIVEWWQPPGIRRLLACGSEPPGSGPPDACPGGRPPVPPAEARTRRVAADSGPRPLPSPKGESCEDPSF